jgi:hypothetical protein
MGVRRDANLLGMEIGRWTVLERADDLAYKGDGSHGKTRKEPAWLCECSCGRMKIVSAANLLQAIDHPGRGSTSCGCIHRRDPHADMKVVFRKYKESAQERGLEFSLSQGSFVELISAPCFYCGAEPGNMKRSKNRIAPSLFVYSGIDRADNELGYIESNCVPCCILCNKLKGSRSQEDFIQHCKRIAGRF